MRQRLLRQVRSPEPPTSSQCRVRSLRLRMDPSRGEPPPAERRLLCSELVTVRLSEPGRAPREIGAILEEIAPHSACLQTEEPIAMETRVRFVGAESAEGGALIGIVVQCRHQQDLGYFSEIGFTRGCTWSAERYRPAHLFDPNSLIEVRENASKA